MKVSHLSADVYAGIVLALLGAAFFIFSLELAPEAAVFPKIVLGAFILLSLIMALQGSLQYRAEGAGKNPLEFSTLKVPLLIFLFITVYVIAMDLLGFCLATAAFFPGVALFYRNKKPLHILVSTVCLIGFIYLLFVVQLKLVLP